MISLQSKVRYAQTLELTDACACDALPAPKMTVVKSIVTQTGRAGGYNPALGQMTGVIYDADRSFPPSITLGAKELRTGLPSAVAEAPEVVAAAKAGLLTIVREGASMPAKGRAKRPPSEKGKKDVS